MKKPIQSFIYWLPCALLLTSSQLWAMQNHWQQVARQIDASLADAETYYRNNQPDRARAAVTSAYFAHFEDSSMEAAMHSELGAAHTEAVEKSFGQLRKAMKKGANHKEISALAKAIRSTIQEDALRLDKAGIQPRALEVKQ